jgi:hypothetical protein
MRRRAIATSSVAPSSSCAALRAFALSSPVA